VLLLAVVVVVVVDLSGVFLVDSATLQPVHRCTPAPYGTLAVPAALPTVESWSHQCINGKRDLHPGAEVKQMSVLDLV